MEQTVREHIAQNPDTIRQPETGKKVTLDPSNPNHKKMMDDFMEKSR